MGLTAAPGCNSSFYDGEQWVAKFKTTGTLTVGSRSAPSHSFDYLVVGGGGGGNTNQGAGGGAGGYQTSFPGGKKLYLNPGSNVVQIGAGGAGGPYPGYASNGEPSFVGFIESVGGGAGGSNPGFAIGRGRTGGSGGRCGS